MQDRGKHEEPEVMWAVRPCYKSGFPPRQPGFEPSGHVVFVVDKVAL
jgi:hypothetical protein